MQYTKDVQNMCKVNCGASHGCAPIPEEGKWVYSREIKDISGFTHGIGWCAPQQGACKISLNVKEGIIEEALIETIGCSGMTHSAAMASEAIVGKTLLEAVNTDLVCDAINTAMRELFLQIVYGRTQSAFSEDGLAIGAGLEDLGKGLRSQVGTLYSTKDGYPDRIFGSSRNLYAMESAVNGVTSLSYSLPDKSEQTVFLSIDGGDPRLTGDGNFKLDVDLLFNKYFNGS